MALTPSPEVIKRGIGEITPDDGNVNTHPADQVRQIAASIRDFGFNDPIAVDVNGIIVEGHGRYMAARYLNMTEVPVIVLAFASEAERRAYAIAHNRTQQLTPLDERQVLNEFDRIGLDRSQYDAVGFTEDDMLFMRIRQEQDAENAAAGAASNAKFAVAKSPTVTLQFATQDQLFGWLNGLDWLRDRYPEAVTMADRMEALMNEYGSAL